MTEYINNYIHAYRKKYKQKQIHTYIKKDSAQERNKERHPYELTKERTNSRKKEIRTCRTE